MEAFSQIGYVVNQSDNVATALGNLSEGSISLTGKAEKRKSIKILEAITLGHKFALTDISCDMPIIKYGVVIGTATKDIQAGEYVHLHNMRSNFDMRAATFDAVTANSTDMEYIIY